jgi:hypothetical protein
VSDAIKNILVAELKAAHHEASTNAASAVEVRAAARCPP